MTRERKRLTRLARARLPFGFGRPTFVGLNIRFAHVSLRRNCARFAGLLSPRREGLG
jgi:hypothetical protein